MQSVVVFAPGNERGGATSHIHTMAKYMMGNENVRIHFVTLGDGPLTDALTNLGVEVNILSAGLRTNMQRLGEILVELPNAILHSHGPRLNILSSRIAHRVGCPWTVTIHSNPYFDFLSSRLKTVVYPRLHLWSLRRATGAFTVNQQYASLLPTRNVWYVPNAIETPNLKESRSWYQQQLRNRLGVESDIQFIGVAARFDPVKNLPLLIEVLQSLPEHVHLALAGDGGQRAELEDLVKHKNLHHRVHFLGFIKDVADFYAGLHVHVLPSKSEGSPSCLLEAGAMGTPNIGSSIPGIQQVIEDGVSGICTPVGDVGALSSAISKLLSEPELAERLVENFQTYVLPQYRPVRMVEAYFQGYERIRQELNL